MFTIPLTTVTPLPRVLRVVVGHLLFRSSVWEVGRLSKYFFKTKKQHAINCCHFACRFRQSFRFLGQQREENSKNKNGTRSVTSIMPSQGQFPVSNFDSPFLVQSIAERILHQWISKFAKQFQKNYRISSLQQGCYLTVQEKYSVALNNNEKYCQGFATIEF